MSIWWFKISFKLVLLNNLNVDLAFCTMCFHSTVKLVFFLFYLMKNWFLEKDLESPLILFFLKEKQNKKEKL